MGAGADSHDWESRYWQRLQRHSSKPDVASNVLLNMYSFHGIAAKPCVVFFHLCRANSFAVLQRRVSQMMPARYVSRCRKGARQFWCHLIADVLLKPCQLSLNSFRIFLFDHDLSTCD